jgi:hypothetical protein
MSWNKLPLAKKVGEVPEDEDKFHSWSGNHGYYTRPETVSNPFKTDKMLNSTFDKSKMIENVTLCTTQREINKSQVEFKPKSGHEPKMLGKSSSRASFVDQRTMSSIMHENGTVENFKTAFDKVSTYHGYGTEPSIPIKSVGSVVSDCMGTEAPEFIVDKFVEACNRNSAAGRSHFFC